MSKESRLRVRVSVLAFAILMAAGYAINYSNPVPEPVGHIAAGVGFMPSQRP